MGRQYGAAYTVDADLKEYEIKEGVNTITLDLDIAVEVAETGGERRIFENFDQDINGFEPAKGAEVFSPAAPFAYHDPGLFKNTVVTRIGIPVYSVGALDGNQTFTISVIDNQAFTTIAKSYQLRLPVEQLGTSVNVGKFVYVDCEISVGENQTLAFGAPSGDIVWSYYPGKNDPQFAFYVQAGTSSAGYDTTGNAIIFDVYAKDVINKESQLAKMQEKEDAAIKLNLLVDNAWSGSRAFSEDSSDVSAGWYLRAVNLHDDTGDDAGTNPDVVAVYLGINDYGTAKRPGAFSESLYDKLIKDNGDGTFTYTTPTNK